MCPIPYLIAKKYIPDTFIIADDFHMSIDAASNAASNLRNRMRWYGSKLFPSKIEFVNHLIDKEGRKLI